MADDSPDRISRARALTNEKIEYVSQSAKAASAKASEKMANARHKADDALNTASHIVSVHPLAAVAGAAAFGAALAMMIPRLWRKQNESTAEQDNLRVDAQDGAQDTAQNSAE